MARSYTQTMRAESAERTRRAVLEALDKRLRSKRTQAISVDLIAQDAGIVRSTVYAIFGSRAGLFDAYADDLWMRSGLTRLSEAVKAEDALVHLRGGIVAGTRMFAANLPVFRRLYAMDALDPDSVGGAVRRMEQDRLEGMRHLARRLGESGLLRPGVDVEHATNVLWTLCSFQAIDLEVSGRGLTADDAATVLASAAERALCGVPAADPAVLVPFGPGFAATVRQWAEESPYSRPWLVGDEGLGAAQVGEDVLRYVLLVGGVACGYGELWTDEDEVELAHLVVDPQRRRRGVGRQLVTALTAVAYDSSPHVFIRVEPDNTAALGLYRKVGFEDVPQDEQDSFNAGQPREYVWLRHRAVRPGGQNPTEVASTHRPLG
ncbi:regulatory protein, tetR family [Micromonospora auratinigra]|uniref:Regulatory protein, tetR family n=2 Tax=Micromonospora auratinigra TaxID=261654 RepID=A0A1A8Z4C0_9ACTN|nr:regulatory protein, tetR family [Micromonospora auratinigra]